MKPTLDFSPLEKSKRERQEEMRNARYQLQLTEVRLKEEERRLSKIEKLIVDEETRAEQEVERLEKLRWILHEEDTWSPIVV